MKSKNTEATRGAEEEAETVPARFSWARSSWFPSVVTLLIIVTGVLGSVWSPEIRSTFGSVHLPWLGIEHPPFNLEATAFWGLLLFTVILFWIQRDAQYTAREKAQSDLEQSQRDLQATTTEIRSSAELLHQEIRTMPPPHFLRTYGRVFGDVEKVVVALTKAEEPPAESIREGIRVVLSGILELAKVFDNASDERYSASIMIYHDATDLDTGQCRRLQQDLHFVDESASIRQMRGVLVLRTDLSVVSFGGDEGEEQADVTDSDTTLESLVLGIPPNFRRPRFQRERGEEKGEYVYVLPGAPLAWADNNTEIYVSTGELMEWCREHGDFTRKVLKELRSYFQDGDRQIGSFFSSPLVFDEGEGDLRFDREPTREDGNGGAAIGVVNIHRTSEGILKGQRTASQYFADLNRPFRLLLVRLIYQLQNAEKEECGTWKHLDKDSWPSSFRIHS